MPHSQSERFDFHVNHFIHVDFHAIACRSYLFYFQYHICRFPYEKEVQNIW